MLSIVALPLGVDEMFFHKLIRLDVDLMRVSRLLTIPVLFILDPRYLVVLSLLIILKFLSV